VRSGEEVTMVSGLTPDNEIATVQIAAKDTRAVNYSFDVTPARLVTGLITERGITKANRESIHALFDDKN
jgi:methylthioribose-1-phosphate isomerase